MTMSTLTRASRVQADARQLVAEIEAYLASRTPSAPPAPTPTRIGGADHRLPPVDQLIAEAGITTGPAPRQKKAKSPKALPGGLWKALPDWTLSARRRTRRPVTVTQHLQLTIMVIQRYGWARGSLRTRSGRRCILGAQAVLYRLGYGDQDTARAAGDAMDRILASRGITVPYHQWNDHPDRSEDQVLYLLAAAAEKAGR